MPIGTPAPYLEGKMQRVEPTPVERRFVEAMVLGARRTVRDIQKQLSKLPRPIQLPQTTEYEIVLEVFALLAVITLNRGYSRTNEVINDELRGLVFRSAVVLLESIHDHRKAKSLEAYDEWIQEEVARLWSVMEDANQEYIGGRQPGRYYPGWAPDNLNGTLAGRVARLTLETGRYDDVGLAAFVRINSVLDDKLFLKSVDDAVQEIATKSPR